MRLIHCSDIHLDIPFGNILTQEKSATRKQEILSAFSSMAGFASEEGVRAVLITGGLVDAEHISRMTIDRVYKIMRDNPDVIFALLPGSSYETAYFSGEKNLPENFRIFSDLDKKLTIDNVDIYGVNEASKLPLLDEKQTNIVITSGVSQLRGFEDRGIAYLGLGLERTYRHGDLIGGGYFCAPGSLEALTFEEGGNKGFMEIYVSGGKVSPVFVRSGKRLCYNVDVDVTGAANADEVSDNARHALSLIKGINGAAMVRINLTGRMDLEHIIDDRVVEKTLGREYFAVSVNDSEVDFDITLDGISENTLRDRFIRRVSEGNESLELKKDIIKVGITAISGGEIQ
ncbi:MAG: hypothetical protein II732_09110 [Lachnospiraceae bacterium]|nr:hypothetical protein [Lachnospiraceae bacterium]MBQ4242957.1 hypothetical protein [Lachnospiraceae bacterium]